jgi:hypothetical protein
VVKGYPDGKAQDSEKREQYNELPHGVHSIEMSKHNVNQNGVDT